MIPAECDERTYWEHVYRYRFAFPFANNRRAVDVACGEGYGTFALSRIATHMLGVDVSPQACDYARSVFNIEAVVSDACAIPVARGSVDLVTSFETIEHLDSPRAFVDEVARVLADDGIFVVSTPNRAVYSEAGHHNDFHVAEMNVEEFKATLGARFKSVQLFSQCVQAAPWWTLTSVSARQSLWRRVRGHWRLTEWAMSSARGGEPEQSFCRTDDHAVDFICKRNSLLESIFSPYVVRRASDRTASLAKYIVAVCADRK